MTTLQDQINIKARNNLLMKINKLYKAIEQIAEDDPELSCIMGNMRVQIKDGEWVGDTTTFLLLLNKRHTTDYISHKLLETYIDKETERFYNKIERLNETTGTGTSSSSS